MSENNNKYRPDWHPDNAGDEFAVRVVKGIDKTNEKTSFKSSGEKISKRKEYTPDDYAEGVRANDRVMLARTITLIESNSESHRNLARQVLGKLMPNTGGSLRIGITGVPGAGKSTLIEALGLYLIGLGLKVAVLAVDPSSTVTRGSILGDKTRMEKLSREANCFIRPSPSGGTLGGVTRKSRETILVCEAAGFDVILIETVGVGQSEITVRSMVDFFLLVMIPGAGDELQGIKKGVIEIADALLVNKADGEMEQKAKMAKAEYSNALHYLMPASKGWVSKAHLCSAVLGTGIPEIWKMILKFKDITVANGGFEERRRQQAIEWTFSMIEEELKNEFYNNSAVKSNISGLKQDVLDSRILPTAAAERLLEIYRGKSK